MLLGACDRPKDDFFYPRLTHLPPDYQQRPGLTVTDWETPPHPALRKVLRRLLYHVRQGQPSPSGLSRLPFELLDMIFRTLCGREVHAVRLVCREWERASRPFWAEWHLQRSLFWLTGSDMKRLERLAGKFGPYMGRICVATDRFTLKGAWQLWKNYRWYTSVLNEQATPGEIRNAHNASRFRCTQTRR